MNKIVYLVVLLAVSLTPARASSETRACEMRIESSWTLTQIRAAVNRLGDAGFNCVRVETFYHGGTIYDSSVMRSWGLPSIRPDFTAKPGALATVLSAAHARGMTVYAWVESYYVWNTVLGPTNPILTKYPEWSILNRDGTNLPKNGETTYYFLSPANLTARRFLKDLYVEIAGTGVDGLMVDYLRYPVQSLGPTNPLSYDAVSIQRAKDELGLDILTIPASLNNADYKRWSLWRQQQVTDCAKEMATAVRMARPTVVFAASVHPYTGTSWKLHDTLRDWPTWWPEVRVFTPQYYTDYAGASAQMDMDLTYLPSGALWWPTLLASDISDGSPLLSRVRTQPAVGVSYWVYSTLTDTRLNTLRSGPFAVGVSPMETSAVASALDILNADIPTLPAAAAPDAIAARDYLSSAPPCTVSASKRLATAMGRSGLSSSQKRDLSLAYKLACLPAEPIAGDVNGDRRVSVADAVRTMAFMAGGSSSPCLEAADVSPAGGDGSITTADALVMLSIAAGLR